MNKKLGYLLISSLFLSGCFEFLDSNEKQDRSKRIIIKELKYDEQFTIEWYHYSLISNYSPGVVDVVNDSAHQTICESSYLSDIELSKDTLKIILWKNDVDLLLNKNLAGLKIKLDTTGVQPHF